MATIAERVREALSQRDGISEEAMRELAEVYGAEVARVNQRLSAAGDLLRKGLRSEAIQRASIAPNALDDAAKLDVAEADEWFDILQFLGISVPPALQTDLVDQLNEAILESQPIEALLRRHRRLAIARAPIAWRLKVLRRIAEQDPQHAHWQEDLENWERARHKEITETGRRAATDGDLETLDALHQELTQTEWLAAPEPATLRSVQAARSRLTQEKSLTEMKQLAPQLHEAFCRFDEPVARELLGRWSELAGKLQEPVPTELAEQVDGAKAWVAELDREAQERADRAEAVGQLEAALDRGAPLHELEKAYYAASLFDEPPPEDLIQRYQVAVAELQLKKKRLFQAAVVSVVAVTLIAAGSLVWWQYRAARQSEIAAATSELQLLLDAGDLPSALEFLEEIQPEFDGTPNIDALESQLDTMLAEERQRAAKFREYLEAAEAELEAAEAEGASEIDWAALRQAEKLAANESEKAAVFQLRRRYEKWEAEIAKQQSEAMLEKLAVQRKQMAEVEAGAADERALNALAEVAAALKALPSEFPKASRSARQQVAAAEDRAKSMRSAIRSRLERMRAERHAMSEILESQSLDRLAHNLKQFESADPNSALAKEFAIAAGERDAWNTAETWNRFAAAAAGALRQRLAPAAMQAFNAAQEAVDSTIGKIPGELPAAAATCLESHDPRKEILERVFGDMPATVIADLYTVVEASESDQRYFLYKTHYDDHSELFREASRDQQATSRGIETVTSDSGAVRRTSVRGQLEVLREPHGTVQWLLKQYQAAEQDFLIDWSGEFLRVAAALRKRGDLDAPVKEMLLQHVLAGAAEGSEWLGRSIADELSYLDDRARSRADWYEPQPFQDSLAGDVERRVIAPLARLYQQRPRPAEAAEEIRQRTLTWTGVIVRDSRDEPVVHVQQPPEADGRLIVARPALGDASKTDWMMVGTLRDGTPALSENRQQWIAGRPVFFYLE